MPSLQELPARARDALMAALSADRFPHGLVIVGAPERTVAAALAVAAARNCELSSMGCAAGSTMCGPCHKLATGIHPDYVVVDGEGASGQVSIEAVRERIVARLGLAAHEAKTRVFVVPGADTMGIPAANALLKTLEEPPRDTMVILCVQAIAPLLPTLRSRCQLVRVADDAAAELEGDLLALATRIATEPMTRILAAAVVAQKGEVGTVLDGAAGIVREHARAAVAAGDLDAGQRLASRGRLLLASARSVELHNMNAALALDELVARELA